VAVAYLTNCGSSSSKGELEEPANQLSTSGEARKEEARVTNESFLGGISATVGKGVTNRPLIGTDGTQRSVIIMIVLYYDLQIASPRHALPKTKGTTTSIEDVLKHNVLHVLLADRSSTEHLQYKESREIRYLEFRYINMKISSFTQRDAL
jgi:hypothetical protein